MPKDKPARIAPDQVKRLRQRTGCGMMECKSALQKAEGDLLLAEGYLHSCGLAVYVHCEGKSDKQAREDWIWSHARAYKRAREGIHGE